MIFTQAGFEVDISQLGVICLSLRKFNARKLVFRSQTSMGSVGAVRIFYADCEVVDNDSRNKSVVLKADCDSITPYLRTHKLPTEYKAVIEKLPLNLRGKDEIVF